MKNEMWFLSKQLFDLFESEINQVNLLPIKYAIHKHYYNFSSSIGMSITGENLLLLS